MGKNQTDADDDKTQLPRRNTHGGSDLRGVRAAAEKRGGTMTLHWENEWFTLRVLLPQKS